jgi:integrase
LEHGFVKSTQLAYPTAQFFEGETPSRTPDPEKSNLENLTKLKLVASQKPEGRQLHHMRDGCVVLYKRDRSDVWQVRFKLFDMKWHCYSTKHKDLEYARRVASNLYDRSRFAEEMGMPLVAKTFVVVAQACLKQLDMEIEQGIKPRSASDYQRVIRKYLIPFFGRYNMTSIDIALVRQYELWRNEQMRTVPKASTLMTHATAYSRVVDLAVERGWLSANVPIPRLSRRGQKSVARPGFNREEIQKLLEFMPAWCEGGHRHTGRQIKLLLRDYVEILLATGMRCGKESMNMLWQHIEWYKDKDVRYLRIWVSGKTGGRWLIAKHRAAQALERLAQRQHAVSMTLDQVIEAKLALPVFAYDDGTQPSGFEGTFKRLLAAAELSKDMSSGQQRTLYSLRHTYATMELLAGTDIHTVARQMGTSVLMLEKHYSKLTATMAAEQLA